ncbi:MAG: DUF1593 domain-containing protein [Bacteroidales bacterium]
MKQIKPNSSFLILILISISIACYSIGNKSTDNNKPRVIVTSDGEIDDECSMVRFLMYANEWDIEGIITSSSQYHWHGHSWSGDDWVDQYLEAYSEVYPNLILHDSEYPSPEYLKSKNFLGNVATEGEMDSITPGSQHIVKVLLDESDDQPIWLQAWGGINTIARALKTIEEEHPNKMDYVANKIRFFFIWEQDSTYQAYIRPHWGKYNILTIISDQFVTLAYGWDKNIPSELHTPFKSQWMTENILQNHGPLCALYRAHDKERKRFVAGDFRSEGDSPAFMHTIVTGLRSMESPDYGGWGGRYVKVHENIWLDPVLDTNYVYPTGIYKSSTGGRRYVRDNKDPNQTIFDYCKPIWRWSEAFQNDWAARADWCVLPYEEANHQPVVKLNHELDLSAKPGSKIKLSAKGTYDPDGDQLTYIWWHYKEASDYQGEIEINNEDSRDASFIIPDSITNETNLHIVCEVKDNGHPQLTRYKRVIIKVVP